MMTLSAFGSRLSVGVEKTKLPFYFWLIFTALHLLMFTTNIKHYFELPYTHIIILLCHDKNNKQDAEDDHQHSDATVAGCLSVFLDHVVHSLQTSLKFVAHCIHFLV